MSLYGDRNAGGIGWKEALKDTLGISLNSSEMCFRPYEVVYLDICFVYEYEGDYLCFVSVWVCAHMWVCVHVSVEAPG